MIAPNTDYDEEFKALGGRIEKAKNEQELQELLKELTALSVKAGIPIEQVPIDSLKTDNNVLSTTLRLTESMGGHGIEEQLRDKHHEMNKKYREVRMSAACPVRPVNRDDALNRRIVFAPQFINPNPDEITAAIRMAEWFDFGTVSSELLRSLTDDSKELAEAGLVLPPYNVCVFRVRLSKSDGTQAEILIMWCSDKHIDGKDRAELVRRAEIMGEVSGYHMMGALEDKDLYVFVRGALVHNKALTTAASPEWEVDGPNMLVALWMLLNTRNIRKRITEPSSKLNKARVRSGKIPLRRVTYIDAAQYERALRETERMEAKGTHASPIMHLRRAHWWPRLSTPIPEGRKLTGKGPGGRHWLPPVLVNQDRDLVAPSRDHYEVKS